MHVLKIQLKTTNMIKPKDKAFWLIIAGYILLLVATYKLGMYAIEERELRKAARETLDTPDLTKNLCPDCFLPPIEPPLPEH